MTDNKLIAAVFASSSFGIGLGAVCVVVGVKKGFVERRMERRGEVFTGHDAVRAGGVYLLIAALCWNVATVTAWAWFKGRLIGSCHHSVSRVREGGESADGSSPRPGPYRKPTNTFGGLSQRAGALDPLAELRTKGATTVHDPPEADED